jgi:hypothetical protein
MVDPIEITLTAAKLISGADSATNLWSRFRRRVGKRKARANLDAPEVRAAAGAFLECNLKLMTTVEWTVDGLSLRDGLVSELGAEALAKFGALTALSYSDALNVAAGEVAKAVGEALQRFPHAEDRRGPAPEAVEQFRQGLKRAMDACGRFVAALVTGELPPDLQTGSE